MYMLSNKEHKAIVLKSAETLLHQYKNSMHKVSPKRCPFCKEFRDSSRKEFTCTGCPMHLFSTEIKIGCLARKCSPVSQLHTRYNINNVDRVIEFYEQFIELVKKSHHCRLTTKLGNYSKFARNLNKLDKTIYNKHDRS